jgi:hypothetical protein
VQPPDIVSEQVPVSVTHLLSLPISPKMMNGRFMPHLQPRALVYLAPRMVTAPIRMICDWGGPNPARLHKAWLYERAITSLVLQLTSAPVVRSGDRILTRGRANDDSSYAHTATCQKSAHQV